MYGDIAFILKCVILIISCFSLWRSKQTRDITGFAMGICILGLMLGIESAIPGNEPWRYFFEHASPDERNIALIKGSLFTAAPISMFFIYYLTSLLSGGNNES